MVAVYTLHFDGACGPKNPGGTAAYGFTLHKGGTEIDRGSGTIGHGNRMTNNVAEYAALTRGLSSFLSHFREKVGHLTVRGDSQLVIKQMSKVWKAKEGLYFPYYQEALLWASYVRSAGATISFEWVPRELNQVADTLSKIPERVTNCQIIVK